MKDKHLTIGELADAAGVSRRAVRFYVTRKLLDAPLGLGRGGHYAESHLAQLRRIQELQQAGHSLDAIRLILEGKPAPPPAPTASSARRAGSMTARLYTRVQLGEGLELSLDATRFNPTSEQLLAVRQAVAAILAGSDGSEDPDDPGSSSTPSDPASERSPS